MELLEIFFFLILFHKNISSYSSKTFYFTFFFCSVAINIILIILYFLDKEEIIQLHLFYLPLFIILLTLLTCFFIKSNKIKVDLYKAILLIVPSFLFSLLFMFMRISLIRPSLFFILKLLDNQLISLSILIHTGLLMDYTIVYLCFILIFLFTSNSYTMQK